MESRYEHAIAQRGAAARRRHRVFRKPSWRGWRPRVCCASMRRRAAAVRAPPRGPAGRLSPAPSTSTAMPRRAAAFAGHARGLLPRRAGAGGQRLLPLLPVLGPFRRGRAGGDPDRRGAGQPGPDGGDPARDASGYFAKLAAMVAFACFVLNLVMLGQIFNITPTDRALLPWAALAFLLAYACDLRLLLAAGICCVIAWVAARVGEWGGIYWLHAGERPENFFPVAMLLFAFPLLVDHRRMTGFEHLPRLRPALPAAADAGAGPLGLGQLSGRPRGHPDPRHRARLRDGRLRGQRAGDLGRRPARLAGDGEYRHHVLSSSSSTPSSSTGGGRRCPSGCSSCCWPSPRSLSCWC
jgi:hypothetical protein